LANRESLAETPLPERTFPLQPLLLSEHRLARKKVSKKNYHENSDMKEQNQSAIQAS
jgi:hypothetical protein